MVYLRTLEREEELKEEGREEGRKEGREEGRKQGIRETESHYKTILKQKDAEISQLRTLLANQDKNKV